MARILIIDDDSNVRLSERLLLETGGHEVLEAGGGAQGIEMCQQSDPDLVVCDILMPGIGGLDTIQELKRTATRAKILALSGGLYGGGIQFLPEAKKRGADATLSKPFSTKEFFAAVNDVLGDSPCPSRSTAQDETVEL